MIEKKEGEDVEKCVQTKQDDKWKNGKKKDYIQPSQCQLTRPAHNNGLVPPAIVSRDRSSSWEKSSFPRTIAPPDRIGTADMSRDQVARCSSWWTEIVTLL